MILKQSNTPNHHSESHANPNSHSEPLGEESHVRLVRDISLSLNMTEDFSHSVLDTESVSLIF